MEEAKVLPCGHYFHASCLKSWMQEFDNCPTCRAKPHLQAKEQQAVQLQQRPLRGQKRTQQLRQDIAHLQEYERNKRKERLAARQVPPSDSGIEEACWIEPHSPDNPPRRSPAIQALRRQANRQPNQESASEPPSILPTLNAIQSIDERTEGQEEISPRPSLFRAAVPQEETKEIAPLEKAELKIEDSPAPRSPIRKTTRDKTLIADVRAIDIPLGALQYSLPRPALTRRTVASEIARKTTQTLNAKFTTLYKRPPRHTIPHEILAALQTTD